MNKPKPRKFFLMPGDMDTDSYVAWKGDRLKMADCEDTVAWWFESARTKSGAKKNLRKMRKFFGLMRELEAYWKHQAQHGD